VSELTLLVLRLAFLLLIWVFVFVIVYTLRSDLFGPRLRKAKADAAAAFPTAAPAGAAAPAPAGAAAYVGAETEQLSPPSRPPLASDRTARRLVITEGPREGMELDLPADQLTIGRSSESGLVIRDDYTSTHHARLMLWNDEWVIQDLDSTNGTFVGGDRVTLPTPVPLGTPVRIGQTTFELLR